MNSFRVEYRDIASLQPTASNPRTHSSKQIRQIADSIEEFGFNNPVLIDSQGGIIAGHGRIKAAESMGLDKVPTVRIEHLNEAQKRAYVIADNKLAENAGWDEELLTVELRYLAEIDVDFDVTITGFEIPEIDLLIEAAAPDGDALEDDTLPREHPDCRHSRDQMRCAGSAHP